MAKEDVVKWQRRLEGEFTHNGLVGGRFLPFIYDTERLTGDKYARSYAGHVCLSDSFVDHFAATLTEIVGAGAKGLWPTNTSFYPLVIADFTSIFHTFRATTNLAVTGYPLEAFALQRNLFEQALLYGALMNGFTSLGEIWGINGTEKLNFLDDASFAKFRKARIKAEKSAIEQMIGSKSQLSDDNREELDRLFDLFNQQVHRSFLSVASIVGEWSRKQLAPSIVPTFSESNYAMFMNRHSEIGWMLLKCMPFLFHENFTPSGSWKKKFEILDASFRIMAEALLAMNKKIAAASIELIDKKFSFPSDRFYSENATQSIPAS